MQGREHLQHLDAVVLMSEIQRPFFADYLPDECIHVVHHGVDTDYFEPGRPQDGAMKLLTVGNHLRDYDTLAQVVAHPSLAHLDLEFVLLCSEDNAKKFDGLPRVDVMRGLSDAGLLHEYQTAHALLLPLDDATANNSVLEGLACGLPLISTELPAVREYAGDLAARLSPKADADGLAAHILALYDDTTARQRMGCAARERALQLSWPKVREQLADVYQLTMAQRA